jgi:hypothetical protein
MYRKKTPNPYVNRTYLPFVTHMVFIGMGLALLATIGCSQNRVSNHAKHNKEVVENKEREPEKGCFASVESGRTLRSG